MSERDDPQLEDVRGWYIDGRRVHNPFASDATLVEPFDRWLAEYTEEQRREAAAEALEEAADYARVLTGEPAHYDRNVVLRDGGPGAPVTETLSGWLTRRAKQIREGR